MRTRSALVGLALLLALGLVALLLVPDRRTDVQPALRPAAEPGAGTPERDALLETERGSAGLAPDTPATARAALAAAGSEPASAAAVAGRAALVRVVDAATGAPLEGALVQWHPSYFAPPVSNDLGARRVLSTTTTEEDVATWPGVHTDEHGLASVPRQLDGRLQSLIASWAPAGAAAPALGDTRVATHGTPSDERRAGLFGALRGALLSTPEPIELALVPRRVQPVLVVDELHRPLAGRRVELCSVASGGPADAATTDGSGWAYLDEPLLDVRWFDDDLLRVHVAGLFGATVEATGDASRVLEPDAFGAGAIVLVAPETGSVEARFDPAWPAGEGLTALLLCPVAPDGSRVPTPLRLTGSFAGGRCRFDGVAFGLPLELLVGSDPQQRFAIAPLTREAPHADVAVPPGRAPCTVRGRLVDGETGAPLAHVAARFEELAEAAYVVPRGLEFATDGEGRFVCAPSVPVLTAVRIARTDGSASSAPLAVPGWPRQEVELGDVPVRLHASALELRLVSTGAPVPGARVRVFAHRRSDAPLSDAERALAVRLRLAGHGADWSRLPADEVWVPAVPAHAQSDAAGVVRASARDAAERWLVHVEGASVARGWYVLEAPRDARQQLVLELEARGELVGTCLLPDWLDGASLTVVAVGEVSGARHDELDRTFPPRATDVSPRGGSAGRGASERLVRFEELPPEPYRLEFHVAEHLRPVAESELVEAQVPGSGFHPALDPLDLRRAFAGLDLSIDLDPAADFAGDPPQEVLLVARSGAARRVLWSGRLANGACRARVVVRGDRAGEEAVELALEAAGAAPVPLVAPAPGVLVRATAVVTPGPLVEVVLVRPASAPAGAAIVLRVAEEAGSGSLFERFVRVDDDGRARFHVAGAGPITLEPVAFVTGVGPDELPLTEQSVLVGGEPLQLELLVPTVGLVHTLDLHGATLAR